MPESHRLRTACVLAVSCCIVYLTSLRCPPYGDTIPARLLPFSIVREGNLDLNEFTWLQNSQVLPYFLRRTADGKLRSKYPVAAPLLATPAALPAVWWLRSHQVSDDDVRFRLVTVVVERLTAAWITALSVALLFLALCRITSARTAVLVALGYGLGTNTWSTSSQALWQHGLAEVALAGLSLCLVREDSRTTAIAAGMFAALGVLARPTMAIFALLAAVFMWRERRKRFAAFCAIPAVGIGALAFYNLMTMGSPLGGYAGVTFVAPRLTRLLGLLISPNRGLLVYTPVALLAIPELRRWRTHSGTWIPYLGAGTVIYLSLFASYHGWWGGHTYGPRFLSDVLPAVALCAAPVVERWRAKPWGQAVLTALVAWSVGVQIIGAYFDSDRWNHLPVSIDQRPERAWDWADLQIVSALRGGWHGTELGPVLWQMLVDPRPALLKQLDQQTFSGDVVLENALPLRSRAGQPETIAVRVTNQGSSVWPAFSDYGDLNCLVVGVWKLGDIADHAETLPLPRNVGPGETVRITGRIYAPTRPGNYELDLLLVQRLRNDRGIYSGAHQRVPVQVERDRG